MEIEKYRKQLLKWVESSEGVTVLLFLFFPLGLYFMWKNTRLNWSKASKIIVTIMTTFLFLLFVSYNSRVASFSKRIDTLEINENYSRVSNDSAWARNDELKKIIENYKSEETVHLAYKEKMSPYEKLSEADAKQKESDLKAKEEARLAEEQKKKQENEAKQAEEKRLAEEKKAEEEKAQQEAQAEVARVKAEEEARGYETGISFDQLARTPDEFKGNKVKFSGKVIQVMEGNDSVQIRLAVDDNYNNVIYGQYLKGTTAQRVLEDDYITVSGLSDGLLSYKSTMGGKITIPSILILKIDQ